MTHGLSSWNAGALVLVVALGLEFGIIGPAVAQPLPEPSTAPVTQPAPPRPNPSISLESLRQQLTDADPDRRLEAARKLGEAGRRAAPASAELIAIFNDPSDGVRRAAIGAIESIGPDAAPDLARALLSTDDAARSAASALLYALGELWPDVGQPQVSNLLANPSPMVRLLAVMALESAARNSWSMMEKATQLVDDPDPEVREVARRIYRNYRHGPVAPAPADAAVHWQVEVILIPGPLGVICIPWRLHAGMIPGDRPRFWIPKPDMLHAIKDPITVRRIESVCTAPDHQTAALRLNQLTGRLTEEEAGLLAPWLVEARLACDADTTPLAPRGVDVDVDNTQRRHAQFNWGTSPVLRRQIHVWEMMAAMRARQATAVARLHDGLRVIATVAADPPVWRWVLPALRRMTGLPEFVRQTLRQNIDLLANRTAEQRRLAIERLKRNAAIAAPALPHIEAALRDADAKVRRAAADALGTAAARRIADQGAWLDGLSDASAESRVASAAALAHLGLGDRATMDTFAAAMRREDWLSRFALAKAAQRAWQENSTIRRQLERMLTSEKKELDRLCVRAALKILDAGKADDATIAAERAAAVDLLLTEIQTTDVRQAVQNVRLLRELVNDSAVMADTRVADAIRAARAIGDPELRELAALAVGLPPRHRREEAMRWVGLLRSTHPLPRKDAALRLARSDTLPPRVAAALTRAVESGDFVLREGLVLGIERAWANEERIETALQWAMRHDASPANRTYAKAALRAINEAAKK